MQDSDFKNWLLIFALLAGGLYQISKRFTAPAAPAWTLEAAHTEDDVPYSVHSETRARPSAPAIAPAPAAARPAPVELAALTPDQMTKLAEAAEQSFKEKGGEKKEAKCVERVDPRTGEKVCKKKKKKKKPVDDAVVEEKAKAPLKDARRDDGIDWGVNQIIASGVMNAQTTKADNAFDTLESWQKLLLSRPDLEETKRFIDHYQRNLVTADVFYKIVDLMLEDSRTDMKLLGVLAAAMTPSISSFQVLAQVVQTERSGSTVRTPAEEALNQYATVGNLGLLASVLKMPGSYASVLAAQKVEFVAKKALPSTTSTTKTKAYFARFVSILQTLTKNKDATVSDQATRSLASLQTLLGTVTVAANDQR